MIFRSNDTQNLIIFLCWCVYASAYFGRYSYSSSINSILQHYEGIINNADAGLVATFFFVAYGAGQIINGFLCKKYSSRYVFPIALGSSAFINLCVFIFMKSGYLGNLFFLLKYLWALNGAAQSMIWSSIIFVFGKNIETKNISRSGFIISTSVPAGTFIAYGTSYIMALFDLYEWSFVLAAAIMVAVAVMWLLLFEPHQRTDIPVQETSKDNKNAKRQSFSHVALITVSGLAILAVSGSFVKDGLQNWIPTILKKTYSFTDADALILATSIYFLGALGALLVRFINKYIKDNILLALTFYSFVSVFVLLIIKLLKKSSIPVVIFFALVMIGNYAINCIITSIAPLNLRSYMNPGLAAGLLDGFCYAGSAISTYLLGFVADRSNNNWSAVLNLLLAVSVCTIVIVAIFEIITRKRTKTDD